MIRRFLYRMAPATAWMLLELVPGYLDGAGGTARWHAAFDAF